ncbi:MAG TPA: MopE-related protein, partial [Flavobacterium sp.]
MKKILLLFCLLLAVTTSAQTNTWTGSVNNLWNNAGNWDLLLVPTDLHDVVIPTGSTVTLNTTAIVNSIWLQGNSNLTVNGDLDFVEPSTFDPASTVIWSNGVFTGGGTLHNYGTINLTTTANKQIAGATVLNNEGTINITTSGDLYITDGILNNNASGIINMQAQDGNLSYSGSASHVLNNIGTIKTSGSAITATIECTLQNTGTISVETGTLTFANSQIVLSGGTYNVVAGSSLVWTNGLSMTGDMSGLVDGQIIWAGLVTIPTSQLAQWNFSGSGGINWTTGQMTGGGTLNNNAKISMSTTANKPLFGDITFNNNNVMTFIDSGDIYIADAIFNNTATGVIDMQVIAGDLSYSGGGSHVLNNYGTIKRTTSASVATIECDLHNFGTIAVLSGNLSLSFPTIELNGGTYNVSAGTFLQLNQTVTISGVLSGVIAGEILWLGTVTVPSAQSAVFAFTNTGNGNTNWQNGTLNGGGILTNDSTMRITGTANKILTGDTTFNNQALVYFQSSGDLYITDGIFNNLANGVIDLRSDDANFSYSGSGSHLLNNLGLIKRTTSTGTAAIECEFHNYATITVQSGILSLRTNPIFLHGGIYNVATGTSLDWQNVITCEGILTGAVNGSINWNGNVAVTSSANFIFTGTGAVNWNNGSLVGGGTLTNSFLINLEGTANKQITGSTILNNAALIAFINSGDLYITDGILNNLISGTIDMRIDAGNLSYSSPASHLLNNQGLIKKSTSLGMAAIECELHNTGTLQVETGSLRLSTNPIHLNGGIYNVWSGAILDWQNIITCTGTLAGTVDGMIMWNGTVTVPSSSTFDMNGSGSINWANGALSGGGTLTNSTRIALTSTANKQIIGLTTLSNEGTIAIIDTGDIYISDGIIHNASSGTIDLQADAGNISYSGSASHVLNNYGLIKKSAGTGITRLEVQTRNYGTIDAEIGSIEFAVFPFTNEITGTITGTGSVVLPSAALLTNHGTFAPGGEPGTLTVVGNYESESTSTIAVDLDGLTPQAQYDVLVIQGSAIFIGDVAIDLGFAPMLNNQFTIATTTSPITTCGLEASTSVIREDLEYTFSIACTDNNKVVLTVINIEAVPPMADAQTFCSGATVADLAAYGTDIQWYPAATGGTPLDDAVLLQSGSYYASQTINGLESDRTEVQVTVTTTPAPAAEDQQFNSGATVSDLEATGTNIQWYQNSAGGSPLSDATMLSTGTYYVTQTLNGCESARTAVEVTINETEGMFYVDADGDTYGAGQLVSVPSEDAETPPAGYSLVNTDCDDSDPTIFQSAMLYVDNDNDGYNNGSETVCFGSTTPTGYSTTTSGTDCNDVDPDIHAAFAFYVDADGDSYGSSTSEMVCAEDAETAPAGYSVNDTDCDDEDPNAHESTVLYIDNDGDGYDAGSESVCFDGNVPAGHSLTTSGTDCDDTNSALNPGAAEIYYNGIDDN